MKIFIERTGRNMTFRFDGKASELLKKLDINREDAIIIRNNIPITLDDSINDRDEISILSVISGG